MGETANLWHKSEQEAAMATLHVSLSDAEMVTRNAYRMYAVRGIRA